MGILVDIANGERYALSSSTHLGREARMDIRCSMPHVSAHHAVVRWTGDRWTVIDLSSRNGTWVDEQILAPGQPTAFKLGSTLGVGDPQPSFRLECDQPPVVMAFPLDGGPPISDEGGMLGIPDGCGGMVSLVQRDQRWFMETEDECVEIADGGTFRAGDREYRLASHETVTRTATRKGQASWDDQCPLRFRVSSDEEQVELAVMRGQAWSSLGSRACFYFALTLARKRIQDRNVAAPDQGWLRVRDLLRMLPDYANEQHLAVDVYRFRRCLADAGVANAPQIIERRRGEIRLGTGQVMIEPM